LKVISAVGGAVPEVNVIKLRRKAMAGCQRNVADSSMLRESHHDTSRTLSR
jgi:hypothetical protein